MADSDLSSSICEEARLSSFVLVHTAAHGAWCWKKVVPLLAREGHKVIAPDLPAHGQDRTPIANVTLKAYTDRICQVLDDQTESVILVGHSMSGIVITQAAEYRTGKIAKLVYLTAIIPPNGKSMLETTEGIRNPNNRTVSDDKSWFTYKDELVRDLFYGDCSAEDVSFARSMLVPQAIRPLEEPVRVSEERYGRIPRVYIECLQDRILVPDFQKKLYTAIPCETVISMNTSHSPFFSAPEVLAKHLLSLV